MFEELMECSECEKMVRWTDRLHRPNGKIICISCFNKQQALIEYIYEKIAPNECLLLYKKKDIIIYATNRTGKIEILEAKLKNDG